jgi:hypothetical protein
VQYFNVKLLEPNFGLARFTFTDRELKKSFEVPEAPRLLGISPRAALLLDRDSLEPEIRDIGTQPLGIPFQVTGSGH